MTAKRDVDIVSPDAGLSALAPTLVSDQAQPVTVRAGRTLQIALAEGAARADTTVFLVHGAGGNQNQWRAVWQALVAQGFRVVAFDLLGHGTSPKPRDRAAYRGSAMAEDVRAVFERYAGDPKTGGRNVVVAHSYGVRLTLAALLALRDAGRPEVFAKAVLLGAQAPDAGFASGVFERLPPFVLELMRPMFAKQFRAAAWSTSTDPALIAAEGRIADRNPMYMVKALFTQGLVPDAQRLRELTLPVLLLAGDEDRITPPAGAQALARALPQAQCRVLAPCGHQLMLEQAAQTIEALRDFIG